MLAIHTSTIECRVDSFSAFHHDTTTKRSSSRLALLLPWALLFNCVLLFARSFWERKRAQLIANCVWEDRLGLLEQRLLLFIYLFWHLGFLNNRYKNTFFSPFSYNDCMTHTQVTECVQSNWDPIAASLCFFLIGAFTFIHAKWLVWS